MPGALESLIERRKVSNSHPVMYSNRPGGGGGISGNTSYDGFARGAYAKNPIVYAAITQIKRSAAEPHIIGRKWSRKRPQGLRADVRNTSLLWEAGVIHNTRSLMVAGRPSVEAYQLIQNQYIQEVPTHPLVQLLNNPNPFVSRGQMWGMVAVDKFLAGNAYLLKAKNAGFGNTQELWRLRPDRVTIVPDKEQHCRYLYKVGNETTEYGYEEVIHFKTDEVLDDWYGMSPLMAGASRIDIDNYMTEFLKTFYERGGVGPGAILTVKGQMEQSDKEEIRERLRKLVGRGGTETLILDNTESSYQQLGLDRGLRDALPKELDAMSEARIGMVFGIPGSILGLLIGYESSSYANKRADWQVFWDITMSPLVSEVDDVLNLRLVPEFGGIDEVMFDLTKIRALQEDEDALQKRARDNLSAGIWSWEEARYATGMDPEPTEGRFFIPANYNVRSADALEDPEPVAAPVAPPEVEENLFAQIEAGLRRGRPRLAEDSGARGLWEQAEALMERHPQMTQEQLASRVGVSVRTLQRYRNTFG